MEPVTYMQKCYTSNTHLFDEIRTDIMDKYTPTVHEHHYILTITEQAIGYVVAVPILDKNTESVTTAFILILAHLP